MFIIIVLLAISGLIGTDLFVPSLPAIAQQFHQPANATQLLSSLFLLGFTFSQLCYGPLSDRIGRRMPLIIGISIFVIGSGICLFASSFHGICVGRLIQGLGVGCGLSLARVIIRDCYPGSLLAIKTSQMAIFISLTPALAPLLGGLLQQYFAFQANFIFLLLYGLILLFLVSTVFPETIKDKEINLTTKSVLIHYGLLIKNLHFMRYATIAGLCFSAIILYANVMPFIIQQQLKLNPMQNGEIILLAALGVSLGSFISSRVVKRCSSKTLVKLGLYLFASNGLLLIFSYYYFGTRLIFLAPFLFLITVGCGFIFPNAVALCFSQINTRIGIAGSLYGSIQILISTLVNLFLNILTKQSQATLGIFYLVIGLLGLLLYSYRLPRSPYSALPN
jgi:Bcr/CflA subfamily drug resistance transporter